LRIFISMIEILFLHFFTVKPNETVIRLTPERSVIGESVKITCESSGLPKPRYSIIHNDTEVSSERTYTISKVNWSDAGTYQCTAENELGRNSKCSCLTVVGEIFKSPTIYKTENVNIY
jgi:hypothetical protein